MIQIVQGRFQFKHNFAEMIIIFAKYFYKLFGENILEILSDLYLKKKNLFSFTHCLFALKDNKVAGMVLFYDYHTKKKENLYTGILLFYKLHVLMLKKLNIFLKLNKTIGSLDKNECYISNVTVYEEYRNQGIAKSLLSKCEKYCQENNLRKLVLDVETDNANAIALYRKIGYVVDKEFTVRSKSLNLSFLRMSKNLLC